MLINMYKDFKCNMGTLVEKLNVSVSIVEGNIHLSKSLQKSEVHDTILSTPTLVAKHVSTHVNKGVEDLGLLMEKLIDCSNNVNQGGTNDVGTSAIICISGLLHTFNNVYANTMPKHCATTMKVRMLTLHLIYVLYQGLLSSRSSM